DDSRGCTPCACDPPQGSHCSSLVTVYTDNTCSSHLAQDTVKDDAPMCIDLPSGGPALGSKSATPPLYVPGKCPAQGGDAIGMLKPFGRITFCCIPSPG